MTTPKTLGLVFAIVALIGASFVLPAVRASEGTEFEADLSGAEEVPVRATPATGDASFELSADGKSIQFEVEVKDITNVIMAHIHLGPVGQNGPVVVWLFPVGKTSPGPPGGGPFSGVLATGTFTAANLVGPLTGKTLGDLVGHLKSGNAYVNVHTLKAATGPIDTGPGNFPGGEIRGQIRVED